VGPVKKIEWVVDGRGPELRRPPPPADRKRKILSESVGKRDSREITGALASHRIALERYNISRNGRSSSKQRGTLTALATCRPALWRLFGSLDRWLDATTPRRRRCFSSFFLYLLSSQQDRCYEGPFEIVTGDGDESE